MKRFYQRVEVAAAGDGHCVLLDGRPLRTPGKLTLALPSAALAEALAREWQAQSEVIRPQAMPLTRLASTALDRMPDLRRAAIEEAVGYARTDLLCYRAAHPIDLVERQRQGWQPLLDWAAEVYGARLAVTTTLTPAVQPDAAVARLRAAVEGLADWPLVGVHALTTALGSLILGLAVAERRIDAEEALAVSLLDELYEIERWGQDLETEQRHAALRRDVDAGTRYLAALAVAAPGNGEACTRPA